MGWKVKSEKQYVFGHHDTCGSLNGDMCVCVYVRPGAMDSGETTSMVWTHPENGRHKTCKKVFSNPELPIMDAPVCKRAGHGGMENGEAWRQRVRVMKSSRIAHHGHVGLGLVIHGIVTQLSCKGVDRTSSIHHQCMTIRIDIIRICIILNYRYA